MPRIAAVRSLPVFSSKGKYLGQISEVLFHAFESRVVGLQIQREYVLGLIKPKPRYVLLSDIKLLKDEGILLSLQKLPPGDRGVEELGFSWDESVIWRKMPVLSATGESVGAVKDVLYSAETGAVEKLYISTGMVGDLAVGRLEIAGDLVKGFSGDAIIVKPEYKDIEASGGAAKAMASGVTTVKTKTSHVAQGFGELGTAAASAMKRSFRSGLGRKAIDKVKSFMEEDK